MIELAITLAVAGLAVAAWELAERGGWPLPRVPLLSRFWARTQRYVLGLWAGLWATVIALAVLDTLEVGDAVVVAGGSGFGIGIAVVLAVRALIADTSPRKGEPDHSDLRHDEAWRLLQQHDYAAAAEVYRELAGTGDMAAMVNLGNLLCDHLDHPDEAAHWYQRAVALGSTTAAENLGLLRLDAGDTDEAREMLELARSRGGTASYVALAAIEYDQDEVRRARDLLEIAILEGELDAYAPLGEILLQEGLLVEAEARLRDGMALQAPGAATVLQELLHEQQRADEADSLNSIVELHQDTDWPPTTTRD